MDALLATRYSTIARSGIVAALSAATVAEAAPEAAWVPPRPGDAHYRPSNLGTEVSAMGTPRLRPDPLDHYTPRTALGRKLLDLRRAHLARGGRLLSWEGIDEEVRLRRGGVADA